MSVGRSGVIVDARWKKGGKRKTLKVKKKVDKCSIKRKPQESQMCPVSEIPCAVVPMLVSPIKRKFAFCNPRERLPRKMQMSPCLLPKLPVTQMQKGKKKKVKATRCNEATLDLLQ